MRSGPDIREWIVRLRRAATDDRPSLLAGCPAELAQWLTTLAGGPEPEPALARAEQLPASVLALRPLPDSLAVLLHQGGYPARLLTLYPAAVTELCSPKAVPLGTAELLARATQAMQRDGASEGLGQVRTAAYLSLCRLETEGAPLEEVSAGLSAVAAACTEATLRHLDLHERIVTFGMGKLGGNELNFFSDIDLIFVHRDDEPAGRAGVVDLHERLRKAVRLLEGEGRFRPLFRVDLRLRPFGSRGSLSLSSSATEDYYERHGRDWERQAWLRGRPIAGALELGARLVERLRPFVYRRSVTPAIFEEIAELMGRARRQSGPGLGEHPGIDVKLDPGGIREAEFSLQALQLLHGGKNPALRTPSTLAGLDRLRAVGLLSDREHRDLAASYRFLRRVEHRLQLADGAQTHRVPADLEARTALAQRLEGRAEPGVLERFDARLAEARRAIEAVGRTIARPHHRDDDGPTRARATVLDFGAPSHLRKRALHELGVRDVDDAEALLQHMASREDGAMRSRGSARRGAEALVLACLDASDPNASLATMVEFAAVRPAHYGIWRFLAEPAPAGFAPVRLAAELFGTSTDLVRGLVGFAAHRGPLHDESIVLLQTGALGVLPGTAAFSEMMASLEDPPRELHEALLRVRHVQMLRIALADLGGHASYLEAGRALSDLADRIVRMLLRDLASEAARERPASHGLSIAVLAVGKYGTRLMDYGSDLDLLIVFDTCGEPPHARAQPEAIRVGQRLITRLQARNFGQRLYEVDMRLRPSGRQGLLVSSRAGFARYHERSIAVWEQLALLHLRPIAEISIGAGLTGPAAQSDPPDGAWMASALPGPLCRTTEEIVRASLVRGSASVGLEETAHAVHVLKHRIEMELARENRASGIYNAKTGYGGLLELELVIGALVLIHGMDDQTDQTGDPAGVAHPHGLDLGRAPLPVIAAELTRRALLTPNETEALCAAHAFLHRLLNRLRMTSAGGATDPERFAQNSPRLRTLARRMGLQSPEHLIDRFHAHRDAVRRALWLHLPTPHSPLDPWPPPT